jgi:site-specific DNA-methyltransferase (adenine-specific)
MDTNIVQKDCVKYLKESSTENFDLTFLDPPFNQDKEYKNHNDNMNPSAYWKWMEEVCHLVYNRTSKGGAIYFMQREKNTKKVLEVLESTGWTFQNLIIWKKKTSAVPGTSRFGKHYQIIAFFTKSEYPRVFNKLRIDPPLLSTEKHPREKGVYVTDVWDDIRELTSGYFAGDEPFRDDNGERLHKQQSPIKLLVRIILTSSKLGDNILDPFAGTGTTLVVAKQLGRNSLGIEIDPINIELMQDRISRIRKSDQITAFRNDYLHTDNLDEIWPVKEIQRPLTLNYIHNQSCTNP